MALTNDDGEKLLKTVLAVAQSGDHRITIEYIPMEHDPSTTGRNRTNKMCVKRDTGSSSIMTEDIRNQFREPDHIFIGIHICLGLHY